MTIVSTVPSVILTPRYVWLKTVSVAWTRYPGCCRSHSSVSARLCLAHHLHRSLCICLHVLICSGILSSCCNASHLYLSISFPNTQWCTADAEVQVPCAENPAPPKMHSFKSDLATMEVGMFRLMPGVLPFYSCIPVFWIYSASLSESRSRLNIKWQASRPLDQFILVSQWDTVDAEIKVPSVENQEPTNVLPLKSGVV